MIYYRVRKEYDQTPKNPKLRDGSILVANELYTKAEKSKLSHIPAKAFTKVRIKKTCTYWFFGARFEITESKWRN